MMVNIKAKSIASAKGAIHKDMEISVEVKRNEFGFELGDMFIEGEPIKGWVRDRISNDILEFVYLDLPKPSRPCGFSSESPKGPSY